MPRKPSRKPPSYHRKSNRKQAYVKLTDSHTGERKDYPLGLYDSPESREKYHRVIAQWEGAGRRLPDAEGSSSASSNDQCDVVSVSQLLVKYKRAELPLLSPSHQWATKAAIKVLRSLYGSTPADKFGPKALAVVRQKMIDDRDWARTHVNRQVRRIIEIFRWGASQEIVSPVTHQGLLTLRGLRRGKTNARETEKVRPVPKAMVQETLPYLSRQVRALVELQLLTGARPSELLGMRPIDIDMSASTWLLKPPHKNEWRGHDRTVYLGPKAQAIIKPFLSRPVDEPMFSPREAETERRAAKHAARRTPLSCGNRPGSNRSEDPKRPAGEYYTIDSYRRSIERACDIAFPPPPELQPRQLPSGKMETKVQFRARLTPEEKAALRTWRKEHRWSPYQLRHRAATEIRRQFGLEAAQLVLGHSSALVTDAIYAQRDESKVIDVVRMIG